LTCAKYVDINLNVNAERRFVPRGWRKEPPGKTVENDGMNIQPYLFFDGRCEEAIAFYQQTLGAEVGMLMRWKDSPDKSMCTPTNAEKVMHSSLRIGEATVMMSDGRNTGHPDFKGFALSLIPSTPAEAEKLFNALADGGAVQMPLGKTFFSPSFGMVADKFGVSWMIVVM
jgi:PhnB protein